MRRIAAAGHHNCVFVGNPAGTPFSTVDQIKGSSTCNKENLKTWPLLKPGTISAVCFAASSLPPSSTMESGRDVGVHCTWSIRATLLSEFVISVKDMKGWPCGVQVGPASVSSFPSNACFFCGSPSRIPPAHNQPSPRQEGEPMTGSLSW